MGAVIAHSRSENKEMMLLITCAELVVWWLSHARDFALSLAEFSVVIWIVRYYILVRDIL